MRSSTKLITLHTHTHTHTPPPTETYMMGTSFTELRLFLHKVSFIINTLLLTFVWDTVCWLLNTLCCSIRALHTCCVSTRSAFFRGQKDGSWKMLNWYCREDEGEQSTPLLQLPPLCNGWCGVWLSCRKRTFCTFLFGQTFRICCF